MSTTPNDRRSVRWLALLAALALLAGACGDDDESPSEVAGDPAIDDATTDDDATGAGDEGDPDADTETDPGDDTEADEPTDDGGDGDDPGDADAVTDEDDPADEPEETTTTSAAPTTTGSTETTTTLPAETGLPPEEERAENEAGVRIDLDETATLACANAEFARDALRQALLEDAVQYTAAAADRSEPSAVVELAELVPEMRAAQTEAEIQTVIDAVLEICVDRGHQI